MPYFLIGWSRMKQLLRTKRILLGIWFFFLMIFFGITSYLIVIYSLNKFNTGLDFTIMFGIGMVCFLTISLILILQFSKKAKDEYIKKLYHLAIRKCEPKVALEYMKDDLTIHTYLQKSNIEDSVLRNAFFLFCHGEFEKSQILVIHIKEKFQKKLEKDFANKVILLKLECLLASMKEDKEEFNEKYQELEAIYENENQNVTYPSEKVDRVIQIMNNIINYCHMNKIRTQEYLNNIKFLSSFEKYTIIAFLMYNDILTSDRLKEEYKNRMNSLFENMTS